MIRDLCGMRFGMWTVMSRAEDKIIEGNRHIRYWNCVCDCGTERAVKEQSLRSGKSTCCGCERMRKMHEGARTRQTTHGMTNTRLYRIHRHILNRCINPNDISYKNYGARGIKVCDEWLSFEKFAEWAFHNGYNDSLTIDRINYNGDYTPENCRWSTIKEQNYNKRSLQMYEYNGEKHCIAEWAELFHMKYKKLWKRLHMGWDIEKALTT